MNAVRHRFCSWRPLRVAAILVAGCGDERAERAPAELEEQLGFSREGIMERQSRVEGRIRDCMKAQGFDYVPVDPFAQQQALTGKARMSDEEFIKQFGYGISTLFGRGDAAVGSQRADPQEPLGGRPRRLRSRALGREPRRDVRRRRSTPATSASSAAARRRRPMRCSEEPRVLAALVGKLDELDERIVQDQRMVKAAEKWSACMADKGYRYEEPDEIDEDLSKRFQAIVGPGRQARRDGATGSPARAMTAPPSPSCSARR